MSDLIEEAKRYLLGGFDHHEIYMDGEWYEFVKGHAFCDLMEIDDDRCDDCERVRGICDSIKGVWKLKDV